MVRVLQIGSFDILLDDEDYERVSKFQWGVWKKKGYNYHNIMRKGHGHESLHLSRFILELENWDGLVVDHINRNRLDNRKSNLRVTTRRINALNSYRSENARIVERHGNRFRVRPFINGKRVNMGSFSTEEEALEVVRRYKETYEI